MYTLRHHRAAPDDKHADDRMHLQRASKQIRTTHHHTAEHPCLRTLHPAQIDQGGHARHDAERGWDGEAFKVFALARRVLGEARHGNVEARQAGEPAEDEEGEEESVERGSKAEGECCCGGCDAE